MISDKRLNRLIGWTLCLALILCLLGTLFGTHDLAQSLSQPRDLLLGGLLAALKLTHNEPDGTQQPPAEPPAGPVDQETGDPPS